MKPRFTALVGGVSCFLTPLRKVHGGGHVSGVKPILLNDLINV